MKSCCLFLFAFVCAEVAWSQVTSVQSGHWGDPTTWSSNPSLPDDDDIIVISSGHTVVIDGTPDISLSNVSLTINGNLEMTDDGFEEANLTLLGYSGILLNGQIIDNVSEWTALNVNEGEAAIRVGDEIVWTACDGDGLGDLVCFLVYEANYAFIDAEPAHFSNQNGSPDPILMPADGNPLPVELTQFEVEKTELGILVKWETSSELNNDYFSLERSYDGMEYSEIANVKGHGSTSLTHNYSVLEKGKLTRPSYYRLKQIDFDGTIEYLGVKFVTTKLAREGIRVYPNPASRIVFLSSQEGSILYKAEIMFPDGRVCRGIVGDNSEIGQTMEVDVSALSAGTYFVRYELVNGQEEVRKLIIK